jgi:hypothetical protein
MVQYIEMRVLAQRVHNKKVITRITLLNADSAASAVFDR